MSINRDVLTVLQRYFCILEKITSSKYFQHVNDSFFPIFFENLHSQLFQQQQTDKLAINIISLRILTNTSPGSNSHTTSLKSDAYSRTGNSNLLLTIQSYTGWPKYKTPNKIIRPFQLNSPTKFTRSLIEFTVTDVFYRPHVNHTQEILCVSFCLLKHAHV